MISFEEKCETVFRMLKERLNEHNGVIVAIDGRCAAGKTTLANAIYKQFISVGITCAVFHMDDFFLRPEQRSADRLSMAGENVDHERFLLEVLYPLAQGKSVTYRPFDCKTQTLGSPIFVPTSEIVIVEGSYSCHRNLSNYYDLRIFLDVEKEEQRARILSRNGAGATIFFKKWIPLEETYFDQYHIRDLCELIFC